MVVLAVLGLAIGISYATASRSLQNARQAQESSQASELIASQAELIRQLSGNPTGTPNNVYRAGENFCITGSGASAAVVSWPSTQPTPAAQCQGLGDNGLYTIVTKWSNDSTDTFTIQASWQDITGQGTDTATLTYRYHRPS